MRLVRGRLEVALAHPLGCKPPGPGFDDALQRWRVRDGIRATEGDSPLAVLVLHPQKHLVQTREEIEDATYAVRAAGKWAECHTKHGVNWREDPECVLLGRRLTWFVVSRHKSADILLRLTRSRRMLKAHSGSTGIGVHVREKSNTAKENVRDGLKNGWKADVTSAHTVHTASR